MGTEVPDGTLHGWKDIANHLGKSVRAVQRWERDLGLPVHRIKTPTGQVVYAFAREIGDWRRKLDPTATNGGTDVKEDEVAVPVEPPEAVGAPAEPAAVAPETPPRVRRRTSYTLATALGVLIVVAAIWAARSGAGATMVALKFSVHGNELVATDDSAHEVWSYDFPGRVVPLRHDHIDRKPLVSDFDGDGIDEVLVAVRIESASRGEPAHESLYCFTRTGHLRWSYTPDLSLRFNGRSFSGPWRLYDLAVGRAGSRAAWLSFGDDTWWPSAVVRLTPDGGARLQFVQSGAIYALAFWHAPSGDYLVAGGVNNDYARASIAVIDANGPTVTSPQSSEAYRCQGCPERGPLFYALLPRTEISTVGGAAYSAVNRIRASGNEVRFNTEEAERGGLVGLLEDPARVAQIAFEDNYWAAHAGFERSGVLHHSAADCPDRARPREVRTWTPKGGWTQTNMLIASGAAIK